MRFACTLLSLLAVAAAAQPVPYPRADGGVSPAFGSAQSPSARFLALPQPVPSQSAIDWAFTVAEPNTAGAARAQGAAPTSDGGLCTLSLETLGGATSGPVVARYGADGAERWAHVVEEWATPRDALVRDVAAVGGGCVAAVVLWDPPRYAEDPRGGGVLEVARVAGDGVAWRHAVPLPPSGTFPGRAVVQADGVGGVWVGVETGSNPVGPLLLVRLDSEGAEAVRTVHEPTGLERVGGVLALAALPDGRAVAAVEGGLLVAGPLGVTEAAPLSNWTVPTAVALDTTGASAAAFVVGLTAEREVEVSRVELSGPTSWTVNLGPSPISHTLTSSSNAVVREGDLFVAWYTAAGPQVARLRGADGAALWQTALPEQTRRSLPKGVVADADGVVVWASGYRVALTAEGAVRWTEAERSVSYGTFRALVPCGDGATCLFSAASASGAEVGQAAARAADGALVWTAQRAGELAPLHSLFGAALAPDGGVYASGRTRTESGGTDVLVVRLTPSGAPSWSVAVDGGGTGEDGALSLDAGPDGGLVLASASRLPDGATRLLTARLRPDGTALWVRPLDVGSDGAHPVPQVVVADADGGATILTVIYVTGSQRAVLTRLGPEGDEVWTVPLAGSDPARPVGLYRVPGGYAVVLRAETAAGPAVRVDRYDGGGTLVGSASVSGADGCVLSSFDPAAGVSADGVVHVAATLVAESSVSCARPVVFRFGPGGVEGPTYVGERVYGGEVALGVSPGGAAAVAYVTDRADWLSGVGPSGDLAWNVDVTAPGLALWRVAAGPGGEAFAVGHVPGVGVPGYAPVAVSYSPAAGAETKALPRLADLPTRPHDVLMGDDGVGYVVLNATAFGVGVAGVVRVEGAIPVSRDAAPSLAAALLRVVGPNPARAGADLRLHLGAPADLVLFDVLGRRVAVWPSSAAGDVTVALPPGASGAYLLRAEARDAVSTARVVVR